MFFFQYGIFKYMYLVLTYEPCMYDIFWNTEVDSGHLEIDCHLLGTVGMLQIKPNFMLTIFEVPSNQ